MTVIKGMITGQLRYGHKTVANSHDIGDVACDNGILCSHDN